MSTHKQRRALVEAVQCVLMSADDYELEPYITDEELEESGDDSKIGDSGRRNLAAIWHKVRTIPEAWATVQRRVKKLRNSLLKNPKRFGHWDHKAHRRYPMTITRKARPARSHNDCAYCGCGWGNGSICGKCKEAGIDGQIIKGTEASKPTTYTIWRKR